VKYFGHYKIVTNLLIEEVKYRSQISTYYCRRSSRRDF